MVRLVNRMAVAANAKVMILTSKTARIQARTSPSRLVKVTNRHALTGSAARLMVKCRAMRPRTRPGRA